MEYLGIYYIDSDHTKWYNIEVKYKLFLIFLAIGLSLFALLNPNQKKPTPVSVYTPAPEVNGAKLEQLVNDYRQENGLSRLPTEESLCQYAEIRAEQTKTAWNHNQFWTDSCLKTNYSYCGENLSRDFQTEQATLTAWINSPTHKENLVGTWSSMCIKCSEGFCAQIFGI